jgi:dTDP-4-dehydrorhamnose reductase
LVAITSWALLGGWDWNSLMVERRGYYESGAFDARCDPPRKTAVGRAVEALARSGEYRHPLLELSGWWRDCDLSRVSGLPHLSVDGTATDVADFVGCCQLRRIPVVEGARRAGAIWARSTSNRRVGAHGAASAMSARTPPDATPLVVEARAEADFCCAANAFLDLVIDGEAGRFRLEDLGPHNQYRAVCLAPAVDVALRPPAARRR